MAGTVMNICILERRKTLQRDTRMVTSFVAWDLVSVEERRQCRLYNYRESATGEHPRSCSDSEAKRSTAAWNVRMKARPQGSTVVSPWRFPDKDNI